MSEPSTDEPIHDEVRSYYRQAATDGRDGSCNDPNWGAQRYDDATLAAAPDGATTLSMGCGNPYAIADLQPGEDVLDLGSGGGLDVILSARRVAPGGTAYGVDFLDEMVEVARANATEAGVTNVEFLGGMIENIPLPDASVDVVMSNCVICLAPDKAPVFAEIARVLRPGGRVALSDVVADDDYEGDDAAWAECGSGALRRSDYLTAMGGAGLEEVSIEYTHETGPGLHAATIRARRP